MTPLPSAVGCGVPGRSIPALRAEAPVSQRPFLATVPALGAPRLDTSYKAAGARGYCWSRSRVCVCTVRSAFGVQWGERLGRGQRQGPREQPVGAAGGQGGRWQGRAKHWDRQAATATSLTVGWKHR